MGFQLAVPILYIICLISRYAIWVMFFCQFVNSFNQSLPGWTNGSYIHPPWPSMLSWVVSWPGKMCFLGVSNLGSLGKCLPLVGWDNLPNMICFNWMWNHHVHNVLLSTCYWTNSWTTTMNIPLPPVFLKFWPVHLVSGSSSNPKTENSFFYMINMIFQSTGFETTT